MKILALQFRYLGDAVLMTPALRAIKQQFRDCELHALVAEEIVPLLEHLPWLDRVWAFPRTRGKARLRDAWPVIRSLRREQFDRSVDFGSGDRSALISRLCGARERLAPFWPGGFLGRRYCYTQTLPIPETLHEVLRNLHVLSAWGVAKPDSLELEIHADPARAGLAERMFPHPAILCHVATSQPKKEWPLPHWAKFHCLTVEAGFEPVFGTGVTAREQARLEEFKRLAPQAVCLPPEPELATYLAVLKRARLFVSGDTGPLHFAAGLGVPTVALFGPSRAGQWAPFGAQHRAIQAINCTCGGDTAVCLNASPCMASILPEAVLRLVSATLKPAQINPASSQAIPGEGGQGPAN